MAKVAHLYYEQNLNQAAIASRLSLSQATISRLLKRALAEQIVRISVNTPAGIFAELEEQLRSQYRLKEAIVVDSDGGEYDGTAENIGAAAAFYVENTLKQGEVIGISSWSATLLTIVDAMHPLPRPMGAQVVQILGGIGFPDAEVHAVNLTERLATLVQGSASFLPAPGIVGSVDAQHILLNDPYVNEVTTLFDHVTLALVGIGAIEPSQLLASSGNIFAQEELDLLREKGAVGDICLRFFDDEGQLVMTPLNDRVIGIQLEQLRHIPRTVGIAGGTRKVAAIKGALKGRWINVLITDRLTAEALVENAI